MTIRYRIRFTRGIMAISLAACAMLGQSAFAESVQPPPVPDDLEVEAGFAPFLVGHAVGTQDYVCLPSAGGASWTFFGPQATLFTEIKFGALDIKQQIITHFLSPNPDEKGTARATWQSSFDSSAVWAKIKQPSTDEKFVARGAIAWLLLEVVGSEPGPTRGTSLNPTKFIQRLNTAGGVAPSTGCSDVSNVGSTALVPYTADYYFFRKVGP